MFDSAPERVLTRPPSSPRIVTSSQSPVASNAAQITALPAIGVSGLPGLLDLRGERDLFGRELRTTDLGLADEIAAAASLLMGQAGEGRPLVLARGIPYGRREGTSRELLRQNSLDLFR